MSKGWFTLCCESALLQPAIDSCKFEKFSIFCSNLQWSNPLQISRNMQNSLNKALMITARNVEGITFENKAQDNMFHKSNAGHLKIYH